jgi:nucleoid DNA-binding protein
MALKKKSAQKDSPKASKKTVNEANITTKKVEQKSPSCKMISYKDPLSKSAILQTIAENVNLKRSEVAAVFEELNHLIECHIGPKNSAGSFTLPGILKIQRIFKVAQKERKGINPFTGEEAIFQAKPARFIVKIRALKKLKEIAANN